MGNHNNNNSTSDENRNIGKQRYQKPVIAFLSSLQTEGGKNMLLMFEFKGPITGTIYGPS